MSSLLIKNVYSMLIYRTSYFLFTRARAASHGKSSRSYGRSTSPLKIPTLPATLYSAGLASKHQVHSTPRAPRDKRRNEDNSQTNRLTFHGLNRCNHDKVRLLRVFHTGALVIAAEARLSPASEART